MCRSKRSSAAGLCTKEPRRRETRSGAAPEGGRELGGLAMFCVLGGGNVSGARGTAIKRRTSSNFALPEGVTLTGWMPSSPVVESKKRRKVWCGWTPLSVVWSVTWKVSFRVSLAPKTTVSGRFWREILYGYPIQHEVEVMEYGQVTYCSERSLPPSGPITVSLGD